MFQKTSNKVIQQTASKLAAADYGRYNFHFNIKTMKKTFFILLLITQIWPIAFAISFNGKDYVLKNSNSLEGNSLYEFLSEKESLKSWDTMITIQKHPNAKSIKEVTGPYYEARKNIVAMKPEAHENKTPNTQEDFVLELFLGAPGKTPHIEFVISRFINKNNSGVVVIIYTVKLPAVKNVDVSNIIKNKAKWVKELSSIKVETIDNAIKNSQKNL